VILILALASSESTGAVCRSSAFIFSKIGALLSGR